MKKSAFETAKNYMGSEKFYSHIGEYIFGYIVSIVVACIAILLGCKVYDWFREYQTANDIADLKKIYENEFTLRILNIPYKNLKEVEQKFEKFHFSEFREEAERRKLKEEDFNNFRNAIKRSLDELVEV